MRLVPALFGAGTGLGLLLFVAGFVRSVPVPPREPGGRRVPALRPRQLAIPLAAGAAVFLVTGWVVGALLAGVAAAAWPRLMRSEDAHHATVAKTEAIAGWAEMLRDTMAAAAGIEAAIVATAEVAPEPIAPAVTALVERLGHDKVVPSLQGFAATLADPTADRVVTGLCLAAEGSARDLGALLGAVAAAARAEATMLDRIDVMRARSRTAVRVVTAFTVLFALGMVVLNRPYLDPYDDPLGQLVLLLIGGVFALAIATLARMSKVATPGRLVLDAEAVAQ